MRGPFHLSFTVLSSIGHWVVFSLAGWSPLLPTGFLVSRGTLGPAACLLPLLTGLSPSPAGLPRPFCSALLGSCRPLPHGACATVWAPPGSLAATSGITFVFFSSGYLDVSVRRVPLHALCIHAWIPEVLSGGSPHSDICGSAGMCPSPQLFAAYHVFHRLPVPRHPPCALPCLTLRAGSVPPTWFPLVLVLSFLFLLSSSRRAVSPSLQARMSLSLAGPRVIPPGAFGL